MYNTCAASLWIRMLCDESRCISPHAANRAWKQEEKVMKHTAHVSWDPLSSTLPRVFGEGGVENIEGTMRSQWVDFLDSQRQARWSLAAVLFVFVFSHSDSMLFIKDNCLFLSCLQIPLYKPCAVSHCAVKQLIEVKTVHGLGVVCLEAFSASVVQRGSGTCSL